MAHHGTEDSNFDRSELEQFNEKFKDMMNQNNSSLSDHLKMVNESYKEGLGATKKFPEGQLNSNDEGEIKVGLTIYNEKLIMNFGKKIMWIGFTKEQAEELGKYLIKKSKEL